MAVISIITGVIAGDVAHKIAQDMNDTDEEIAQHIEEGNIDKAIEESNRSMMGNIYIAVKEVCENREDVDISDSEMAQFKHKIEREAGESVEKIIADSK